VFVKINAKTNQQEVNIHYIIFKLTNNLINYFNYDNYYFYSIIVLLLLMKYYNKCKKFPSIFETVEIQLTVYNKLTHNRLCNLFKYDF